MLKLMKHTTVLVQSLFSLGSVVDVLPTLLKKTDFWAILHYILYPNKMTLLNKVIERCNIDCMLEFGM